MSCHECAPWHAGDLPEDTHHAQQKLQVDVLDLFRMVDNAANGSLTGLLPKREMHVLLKGEAKGIAWTPVKPSSQNT